MKQQEIIFAGFGGQGTLTAGKILAYAGMDADMNVSWLPSYGPEMRGGTANCSVILSEEPVGSPIITEPSSVVVMNRPSMDKFEPMLQKGGLLVIDSDLINREPERGDIEVIEIPAESIAEELGNKKIANMVLLGAIVKRTGIVTMDMLLDSLKAHSKASFFDINKAALERGASYVK